MWQRFTEEARRAILLAQEEAVKLQTNKIETEHLLMGLLRLPENVTNRLLASHGITYEEVCKKLSPLAASQESDVALILTLQAKRVLEYSADEARRLGHDHIGIEHILLGLMRSKEGLASRILRDYGFDLKTLRAQIAPELAEREDLKRRNQLKEAGKQLLKALQKRDKSGEERAKETE